VRNILNEKPNTKLYSSDTYILREKANKNGIVYGPWNEGVVKATDDFLKNNPRLFKEAYWLEGTQLSVLIKY